MPVAAVVLWGIGWVLYRTVISKVITRDLFTSLLATFGIAIVIQQSLNLAFGPDTQSAQADLPTLSFADGLITIASTRIVGFVFAIILAVGVILFMKKSRMGQAIRATAQDARAARVLGIDTEKVYSFTFCLNAAICGAAGALVAVVWNVQPFLGTTYSIRLFVIVTAAGFGNLPGVIAAGFGMGVFEQFGGFIFGFSISAGAHCAAAAGSAGGPAIAAAPRAAGRAMTRASLQPLTIGLLLLVGVAAPLLFPSYTNQIAVLWLMIVFASTWDILGGQMGYNSLGNIFFFGAGMYASAVVQIGLYYDVGMYTSACAHHAHRFHDRAVLHGIRFRYRRRRHRGDDPRHRNIVGRVRSARSLFRDRDARRCGRGCRAGGFLAMGRRRLRHIDAGVSRRSSRRKNCSFYFLLFALAFVVLLFLRWLYSTNFGMAINAIRDDEEKAEAMGLHTRRYKRTAWSIAAFFLGIAGAIFGNMTGFIDARDIAFPTTTFNIFMILMVLLGGKGTFWGPVVGAVILSRHQGSDLDLFPGMAIRGARPAHRHHRRLFPAGHRRLVDGEISGTVRSPRRTQGARSAIACDRTRTAR